jgi:hypothetical protein|tara:strand:+ start:346 stop:660 length:315 start_codon:yes stop_codon:yes gene_type:complete
MYKIRGKIIDSKTETIESKKGDTFEKMLITIEESDSGFNHKHQFEIFGKEAIDVHNNKIVLSNYISIDFYIKSNEWKGKFFVSLNVKDIIAEDKAKILNEDLPF